MKFSCEKYLLQTACSIASRAAASKSPIPALEGLQISAEDKLYVKGYDLKEGIVTGIEADIAQRGVVVVGARLFGEMIRRLPDGIVTVSSDEKDNISVKCGKSQFNILGISAEDYPELPSFDTVNSIRLPQRILKDMINKTIFAVSTDEARPIYTGTLFEVEENRLTLVSVDGYRLARRTEELADSRLESCTFVVPGNTLSDVEKICSEEDGDVSISVGSRHISFEIGDTVVVSRRLEGEFLNYRRSIPETFKYEIKVDRTEFMASIDRVSLIVSEKNSSPVRMTMGDGTIDCLCVTPIGRAEDVCTCEGNGEGLLIGFNDRYMKDALKAAGKDELKLCINSAASPCIIKAADGSEDFTYMVLPVRLHA